MITRSAIFEGKIKDGYEERFFAEVQERLAPLWQQFPNALDVRLYRVDASDEDAPPIVMIQQVDYPSVEDMEAAIASPARDKAREVTLDIMQMFEGRFYHVVSSGDLLGKNGARPSNGAADPQR